MKMDNRLMRMLHVLLHIALHDGAATSQTIAKMLGTHPVVVRRSMSNLREQGYVQAIRGPGGGWRLARALEEITIFDVYVTLGLPSLIAIERHPEHPTCPVERSVAAALDDVAMQAEAAMLARFKAITLADLVPTNVTQAKAKRGSADMSAGHRH
jgi:Rrf2 family protein